MQAILTILNTYHFAATAPHLVDGFTDEVLQPKRQAELETLVKRLAGNRLLLIIGAGHGYLLRQVAKETGELRLTDIRRYLR